MTAQEQKEKYAGWSVSAVHSVWDFGCICAASQEVGCQGMDRTVEPRYASQSNDSKTLYVWRLISNIAHQQRLHVLVIIKKIRWLPSLHLPSRGEDKPTSCLTRRIHKNVKEDASVIQHLFQDFEVVKMDIYLYIYMFLMFTEEIGF